MNVGGKLCHSNIKLLGIFRKSLNLACELSSKMRKGKKNNYKKDPHVLNQGSGVMLLKFLFVSKMRRYPDE